MARGLRFLSSPRARTHHRDAAQVQHFEIDNALLRDQQKSLQQALARSESKMAAAINSTQRPAMQVSPNPAMIFGYSLFALADTHVPRGESTDTALRYLTLIQEQTGNWRSQVKQRPPFEASDFAATALMVKAGREYAPPNRAATAEKAADSATRWLISTKPEDTEDRTFQLLGLHWAGAPRENTVSAGRELLLQQRADGGWPQTSALASDAYATGEALVALRAAGIVPNNDPAFKNGIDFLLRTQAANGSWHVRSRAQPIQAYFETGFPYGRDQFISYTATCWATLAMLSDGELDVSPIQ